MRKVAKSFDRRKNAALQRVHLPTEEDLIYGMPFYGGELESDVKEYAARTARITHSLGLQRVELCLMELSMSVSIEGVVELANAASYCEGPTARVRRFLDSMLLRRRIYLAAWGQRHHLADLAMETLNASFNLRESYVESSEQYLHLTFRSIELLAAAAGLEDFRPYLSGGQIVQINDPNTNLLRTRGIRKKVQRGLLDESLKDVAPQSSENTVMATSPQEPSGAIQPESGIVVVKAIGNVDTSEGKVARSYALSVIGRALPVVIASQIQASRLQLFAEFPHAKTAIDALLWPLAEGHELRLPPTVLVGDPGSGKSYFCKRLFDVLETPYTMIPFAGVADSALIGTSRRYSTGEPSLPVTTVISHKVANPGIILDEIDKTGSSRHNGNPIDAMLPMLEPTTASIYQDPYIQAPVDVSHINWIMTANSVSPLSLAFRDRCRILAFPRPSSEFLSTYVANILPKLARDRGQPAEMFALAPFQLQSLENWTDGSLRTLTSMFQAIVDEHEVYGRTMAN